MFHRLQKPKGTTGSRSLCLNYHLFWAPLSIVQALRYRHWSVAVSSLGYVLATIIIPVFQNYAFFWAVYDGAALDWPATYSWQVALVDSTWAYLLMAALAAAWCCGALLMILLWKQETGLSGDIRGIAGLLSLLGSQTDVRKNFGFLFDESCRQTHSQVELFKSEHFCLTRQQGQGRNHARLERVTVARSAASPTRKKTSILRNCYDILHNYVDNYGHFFPFRPEVFTLWLVLLFLLMSATGWITASLNRNADDAEWNYSIPIDPNVYLIVGVFIQVAPLSP
jgi:Protein of unknown function (DUF3433)